MPLCSNPLCDSIAQVEMSGRWWCGPCAPYIDLTKATTNLYYA